MRNFNEIFPPFDIIGVNIQKLQTVQLLQKCGTQKIKFDSDSDVKKKILS